MAKRQVFYSFNYKEDVFRVQQIRNIGVVEGNKPVTANKWEEVKKKGDKAIKTWIDENMAKKSCVIVLIGSDTYNRKWINYEIEQAWNRGKPLLGIRIHNIKCMNKGTSTKGKNPFDYFTIGTAKIKLSTRVPCYNPKSSDAYNDISKNLFSWIEDAIKNKKN